MAPRPHHTKKPRQFMAHTESQAGLGYPDAGRYRRTPPGAPTVADLVHPGDTVGTSYCTGGVVIAVTEYAFTTPTGDTFPHFTIVYVPPESFGRHRDSDLHWINECVAIGGRILMLFENNTDEVFVVEYARRHPDRPVRSILISQ